MITIRHNNDIPDDATMRRVSLSPRLVGLGLARGVAEVTLGEHVMLAT